MQLSGSTGVSVGWNVWGSQKRGSEGGGLLDTGWLLPAVTAATIDGLVRAGEFHIEAFHEGT